MADTTITPRDNGPLLVRGSFVIVDGTGNEWKLDRDQVALCRCGQSSNKPFCDGAHRTAGFEAISVAPTA